MRIFVTLLALLCTGMASAQMVMPTAVGIPHSVEGDDAQNIEPTRAEILPFNKIKVIAGTNDKYAYISLPTEWACSRTDTKTVYAAMFNMPIAWLNRQALLRIGYSSCAYEVRINDKSAGYTPSGAVATEFNISKLIREGSNSIIIIQHNDALVNQICPATKDGIADVKIVCQPTIRIRDILCTARMNDSGDAIAEVGIVVKCDALNSKKCRLEYALNLNDSTTLFEQRRDIELDMRREDTVRFSAIIPRDALWSSKNPRMVNLVITNRIDGRIAECVGRETGIRVVSYNGERLLINGVEEELHFTEYESGMTTDNIIEGGYNGVILTNGDVNERFYDECDYNGIYVISCSAINTTNLGEEIVRGTNPSNEPQWHDTYIYRNKVNYDYTKSHASVIGYAIGKGKTVGVNVYDAYLYTKLLVGEYPVIYEGSNGKWCSDTLKIR